MGQKKYGDALELLMAGAEALFKAGQSASAADLALLVLELYSQSHTAVNDESRGVLFPAVFLVLAFFSCWFLTMDGCRLRSTCALYPWLCRARQAPVPAFPRLGAAEGAVRRTCTQVKFHAKSWPYQTL
jgi:hypothetical protein